MCRQETTELLCPNYRARRVEKTKNLCVPATVSEVYKSQFSLLCECRSVSHFFDGGLINIYFMVRTCVSVMIPLPAAVDDVQLGELKYSMMHFQMMTASSLWEIVISGQKSQNNVSCSW
jgi:hypothetical protein